MIITLLAKNIVWDTDWDVELGSTLPTDIIVELDLSSPGDWADINTTICNQLSDQTGWCVEAYELEGYNKPV